MSDVSSLLLEVFDYAERLMAYLARKKEKAAFWLGVFSAAAVLFIGVVGVVIVNVFADMYATRYFLEHPSFVGIYIAILLVLSVVAASIAFFRAKKRYMKEHASQMEVLGKLKKGISAGTFEENPAESALKLMDQISMWLLEAVRYKREEAAAYGLVAFTLTALIFSFSVSRLPFALLIGIIVWLYFRHEKQMEATRETQKFEYYRKKFEEEKRLFLKKLEEAGS